jgi:hypothetical protein
MVRRERGATGGNVGGIEVALLAGAWNDLRTEDRCRAVHLTEVRQRDLQRVVLSAI